MSEPDVTLDRRAEIALRNRRRKVESRERKLTMAVFGLLAYSAFGNSVGGIMQLLQDSPWDAGVAFALAAFYLLGVYRVWLKDDTRWWPVALPAGLSIAWLLLVWWAIGKFLPIPLVLNVVLLVLVPLRAKASAALAAVPNNSFKPNPLRGSA